MSLFDKKPLTEDEIVARLVCHCDHTHASHGVTVVAVEPRHRDYHRVKQSSCGDDCEFEPAAACRLCGCVEFREVRMKT